ncbi:MAG: hypothetical protein ACTSXQ_06080 [Alphaproteobacteria bacterium]
MANQIKLKQSSFASLVPNTNQLREGELAINTKDEVLYTKNADGKIVEVAGKNYAKKAELLPLTVFGAAEGTVITADGQDGYKNSNIIMRQIPVTSINAKQQNSFNVNVAGETHLCMLEFMLGWFSEDADDYFTFKCHCLTGYQLGNEIETHIEVQTHRKFYADFQKSGEILSVDVFNKTRSDGYYMGWYRKILALT